MWPAQKAFEQEESNKTKGLSLSITCGGWKGGFLLQDKKMPVFTSNKDSIPLNYFLKN